MCRRFLFASSCFLLATQLIANHAQDTRGGIPVSFTLTDESSNASERSLGRDELNLREEKEVRPVIAVKPAGRNGAGMQLLLLIDDSARPSFGTQLQALKQFVSALPNSTEIAIGYMRNGTNQMVAQFTRDHQAAAGALRLAMGAPGADVSPYDSLSDAIKHWPSGDVERRQVIMISSGIEGLGGGYSSENPYVSRGIEDAQRAGITVYTIYNPSSGMRGRFFWRSTWGQNFLSQLADETGGEAYNINMGEPVSLEPFLREIQTRMLHQYIVTFAAKPENRPGLRSIRVSAKQRDSLAAPSKVFVKAGM